MFTTNPFAVLVTYLSPAVMQGYVILMILTVAIGTGYDLLRDGKARFFLQDRQRAKRAAKRRLGTSDLSGLAVKTLLTDIATFGEFCNLRRRISHIFMFYGFMLYLLSSVVMVFAYSADSHPPAVLPLLWNLGVVMALIGGYWFFFFLRVNVVHDGQPPWRLVRADLFIVMLLASLSFALLFAWMAPAGDSMAVRVFAGCYLLFTTLLFVSVPWSKFPHMFYKPIVAFQRRVEMADGSADLPTPSTPGGERCPHSHT